MNSLLHITVLRMIPLKKIQQYTASPVKNIYHPALIEECKANMDKSAYKDNLEQGVVKPYIKREKYIIMNEEYCPKRILE